MKKEAFIYTWSTEDEDTDAHNRFHIRMYGMDGEGKNVCLHVTDFMPYFYVELAGISEDEMAHSWNGIKKNLMTLMSRHDRKDCKKGECEYCWKGRMRRVVGMKKLYFHHRSNSFSMVQIFFPNNTHRKKAYYRLQGKAVQVGYRSERSEVRIHENEASPILQFCTQQKMDSCGWVKWTKNVERDRSPSTRQTLCEREIVRSATEVVAVDEERSPPLPMILSFDIEVYSSVPSRMPDASVDADAVFQISMVLTKDHKHVKKILLTLGKPTQTAVGKDVVLKTYDCEADLLLGFTEVIREENPNVIIGYNIFGFDLMYMIERAKKWGVMDRFDRMGARTTDRRGLPVHAPEKEISWSSSAYSCQSFCFLDAEGRLFVDLLPVIRRDYKFENYRLKTVSEHFVGDTKDPITPRDIFESYRLSLLETKDRYKLLGKVGRYCVQDSVLVLKLFDKLQMWIGLCEMAKTCRVPILTLYTQGQQIKVFSQLYYQCTHDNTVVQSPHSLGDGAKYIAGADHYSGAMVFTPDPGVYDWVIPFDFSSLYPTTIIAYNIDFSTMVIDPNVPDDKCHVIEWWDHIGCEHDKTVHATKPKSVVCQPFRFRFLKEPMGVIPRLLQQLLRQRKQTKGQMKDVTKRLEGNDNLSDAERQSLETLYQVYDKRQLAYKVSANSMYGAMGVKKGYLPFLPGAMCTTAMGRCSIQKAADYVRKTFDGRIVYGDTDSIYCHFPLPDQPHFARRLWDHAKHIETDLLKLFPDPMKLVFEEKIYKKFLILTKKRYMALTCDHTGEDEDKLTIRGVLLARRDNAKWVRGLYEQTVRGIMANETLEMLIERIVDAMLALFRGGVSLRQFIVSKTLGKDYATRAPPTDEKKLAKRLNDLGIVHEKGWEARYESRSKPAHAQLAEKMKARGCVVEPGSRIEFVVVRHPDHDPKLFERIEDPNYLLRHPDMVRIDPLYYAQNLVNPMDQILEVCFKKKDVVKKMTITHANFRVLMDELLWRMHPYQFCQKDGTTTHHPDAARFQRARKKKTKTTTTKKTKTTTTTTSTTASKKRKPTKDDISVAIALETIG
jgi:DNA polymerase elongation subunit (family B)